VSDDPTAEPHHDEPHHDNIAQRLNWLRAGVLGANDGIVSTAGIVLGVAGATASRSTILTAGVAGLTAGAMSMAVGEYVSVSSQRDTERALLAKEGRELRETPEEELVELTDLYAGKGLSHELAAEVAEQLTAHDALAAHAEVELGINPGNLTSPWRAAFRGRGADGSGADGHCCGPAWRSSAGKTVLAQRDRRDGGDGCHLRHRHAGRPHGLSADPVRHDST